MADPLPPAPDRDEAFLEELIRRGWATKGQAEEARRLRAASEELGRASSLDDILAHKGFVSTERINVARREVAARTGQTLRIGKYEILGKLGEGGAGIVYRAFQTALGREVALKVLSRRREGEEEYIAPFLREAKVAVTLNHVNIVRGLDFGKEDGYHFFAMELVEGESLMAVIKREGRLLEKKALDVGLQMTRALEHAQKFQIVHRDVKPENILLTRSGTAKLADLGLARPKVEGGAAGEKKAPLGTALYVAPEQLRGVESLDFRADVYALGCTLFHALTGSPPYSGQTVQEIGRGHLSGAVPNPRDRVPDVSVGAASIVMKMMAKDPADRYTTLEALAEDLDSVLDGRPPVNTITLGKKAASLSAESVSESTARRAGAEGARSRAPLAVVGAVVVALAAGGAFLVLRKKEPPPAPNPNPVPVTPGTGGGGSGGLEDIVRARESRAEEALKAAEAFGKEHGEDRPESVEKLLEVAALHEGTSAGRRAKERAGAIDKARGERIAGLVKRREDAFAKALAADRFGEALAAWENLTAEESSFGGKDKAAAGAAKIEEAVTARIAAAKAVAARVVAGDEGAAAEAKTALAALGNLGIPGASEASAAGLREIEAVLGARGRAMDAAEAAWPDACADALQAAAKGPREAAAVLDARAALLKPLGDRVEALRAAVAGVGAFADAVLAGFAKSAAAGETVRLRVPGRPGGVVAGRATAVRGGSFEIQRGPAVETVPPAEVETEDLAQLAWKGLGAGGIKDHASAGAWFLSRGAFALVEGEVKALEVLGAKEEGAAAAALLGAVRSAARSRAEAAVREAELFRIQKRPADARASLEKAVGLCEGFALPRWKLGALLLETGRDAAEATKPLEEAAALGPAEPEAWLAIAEGRRRTGRSEEALAAFEKYLELAPPDAKPREAALKTVAGLRAAVATTSLKQTRDDAARAYRKDDFAAAEELWRKVVVAAPDDAEAMYFLGKSLVGLDKKVDGYSWLRRFLLADRKGGSRVEDARKIVKDFEQRLAESPAARNRALEGSNLINQNRWQEGVDALTASLDLAPLRADSFSERARGYFCGWKLEARRDLLQQALRDCDTAILISPTLGKAWTHLCMVCFDLGDFARSAEAGAKGAQLDSSNTLVYEFRSRALSALGKFAEAEQAATDGIAREKRAMFYLARAEARCGAGNLAGAHADLDEAVGSFQLTPMERDYRGTVFGKVLKAEKSGK